MVKKNQYSFPDCICGQTQLLSKFIYREPPKIETIFFDKDIEYYREVKTCQVCGHFISFSKFDFSELYQGNYVDKKYADSNGLYRTFKRIVSLPPEKSDNNGRINRIIDFTNRYFPEKINDGKRSALDVGAGLCVFLNMLKEYDFACTALDPDQRAVEQAKKVAGVNAVCGDFLKIENIGLYDLITFNKVLEHVKDPVLMLTKANEFLNPGGVVYVEVPDGEIAQTRGAERQEFAIDHFHVFSVISFCFLAIKSGFDIVSMGRLREPSGKFTLWGFLTKSNKN